MSPPCCSLSISSWGIWKLLPKTQLHEIFDNADALEGDSAITYCGGGVAASLDALALTLIGVPKVTVYHGSMTEWAADPQLPMETGKKGSEPFKEQKGL